MKLLSRVWLLETPWTVAYQAPPSMGFSRQEYWSGLPFPSPGDLLNPGIELGSPASKTHFTIWAIREAPVLISTFNFKTVTSNLQEQWVGQMVLHRAAHLQSKVHELTWTLFQFVPLQTKFSVSLVKLRQPNRPLLWLQYSDFLLQNSYYHLLFKVLNSYLFSHSPTHFFNQGVVAIQCWVSFCCPMKWISYMYTYIPSLLKLPPIPTPIPPL